MYQCFTRRRLPIHAAIAALCAAAALQVACGSSAKTFTTPASVSKCAVTTDPSATTFSPAGGTAAITVNTERECVWNASTDGPWLKVMAGSSGQGPGTVQVAATPNADPVTRTATVLVNSQQVQLKQEAAECVVELPARSASFSPSGGTGSVEVRASSSLCTWAASSNADWITITSGASGKGSAAVAFTIASTSGPPRSGTITIANLPFTVTQSAGCSFDVAPLNLSVPAAGGSATITVTSGAGCAWTAASADPWIAITAGASGTGNGIVTLSAAATTGPPRSGTLIVAGQPVTVNQGQGCTFSLSESSRDVPSSGGSVSVGIAAAAGCAWTASSGAGWIGVSPSSGSGNATVQLAVAANPGAARTGTATIGGRTFTIVQAGAAVACAYSLAPSSQQVGFAGGSGSFTITTDGTCPWTATATVGWISVTSAPSGVGTATVQFTALPNTGAARSGTISIAGQSFTVTQAAAPPAPCAPTVSPEALAAPATAGTQSVQVTAGEGCSWTAASTTSWISISGISSGSGSGVVQLAIAANTGPARSGTATIATKTVTVSQENGCTFSISPTSQNFARDGGKGSVTLTTGADCDWSARSEVSWIKITKGASGTGSRKVEFDVDDNRRGSAPRTGRLTIAGQTFTVNQGS
jgi:hypothetical protein